MKIRTCPNPSVARGAWVIVVALFLGEAGVQASERWATLEAIHKLENPNNSRRIGAHGERGAYQFRAMTWRMHTSLPFERAHDRSVSDIVAVKHYEWLKRGFEAAGMPVTPYNIALAWNGGLTAAIRGTSPKRAHEYAERAANLTATYSRPKQVAAAR